MTLPLGKVAQALLKAIAFFCGLEVVGAATQLTSPLGTRTILARGHPRDGLGAMEPEDWTSGLSLSKPPGWVPVLALMCLPIFLTTKDSMLKSLGEPELTESFGRGVECLLYSPLYLQDPVPCLAHGRGSQKLFVG